MRYRVVALVFCLTLLVAAPASAQNYFTKRGAEKAARSYVKGYYTNVSGLATSCRPRGLRAADPHYVYRRWVCGWAAPNLCSGQVRIIGSRSRWYSGAIEHGVSCDSAAAPAPPPQSPPSYVPPPYVPPPTTGNFGNGNGYVVTCSDGTLSDSGGIQGACSHHGGVG